MGWGVVFQMRWGSFLSDGVPLGSGIGFGGGIFEKNRKMGGGMLWETLHVAIILFSTGLYNSVFSTTLDM